MSKNEAIILGKRALHRSGVYQRLYTNLTSRFDYRREWYVSEMGQALGEARVYLYIAQALDD